MKLLFKNTTKYSKEIYDEFLEFHRKKYRFSYILYTVIIIACILFCTILQLKYHNLTIAIILCCGLTCFFLWRYLHPIYEVSKEYNSDKISEQKQFTFKFYEKFFTIEDNKNISKVKYYKLHKVFETQTFFYLYIDRTHSFLIDKSKFIRNKTDKFSIFIKKKCFLKYSKVK